MRTRAIALVLIAGAMSSCSRAQRRSAGTEGSDSIVTAPRDIDAVLAAHTDSLLAIPGVVGTAIGMCGGERCIKVLVANPKKAAMQRIPAKLEGYRVLVEVTGPIMPR